MSQTWTQIIKPPKNGELVNQEVTGRSIKALQERTDYLYQHLTDFSAANGKLVIQNAEIDPTVDLGDWVYFDAASSKYKRALAEGVYNPSQKRYEASNRAYAVGMCIAKSGGLASILMHGWIQSLSALGINSVNMVHSPENYIDGRFYLSSQSPGKMSSVGVAPIVQLGYFSGDTAFVSPLQKDIFESHVHYTATLAAKPAASQNTASTGVCNYESGTIQRVDYFYSQTESAPENIVMAIRGNGGTPSADYGAEFRIEIYLTSANKMGIDIFVDGAMTLDIEFPYSGQAYSPAPADMDWPQYGEWVDIPNTGISVAFVNLSAPGIDGLPEDIKAITANTSRFKFFYPDDTIGWTNANPYDGAYAANTSFRYVREFDTYLNPIWPPIPPEGISIENNGFRLVSGVDFKCSIQELMWIPAGIDLVSEKSYCPWSFDYPGAAPEYSKKLDMFFAKANISTSKSVVTSLQSGSSALVITDCFTKQAATAGNLQIDLNLNLNTITGSDASECLASIDADTQRFITSALVSRLKPGTGISIKSTASPNTNAETGSLTISSDVFQKSGEVSVVSLKNAKESLVGGITPCIMFLDPSAAKCQAIAKIRIPIGVSETPQLSVSAAVFGTKAPTESSVAVFKVLYYVMRLGTALNSFIEENAFAKQVWKVPFNPGYSVNTVMSDLYPNDNIGILVDGNLALTTGTINGTGGASLEAGDTVLAVVERISSYSSGENSASDNYSGAEVGLTNITWQIA